MFESHKRLGEEIETLLEAIRRIGDGRYACLIDRSGLRFEASAAGEPVAWLRKLLLDRREALFAVPQGLETGGAIDDVFEHWSEDEFLVAFVNGRVALVVACPEAEALREAVMRPLTALVDRLLRYDETYRMDREGRGFFFGRPRLDLVVIGSHQE